VGGGLPDSGLGFLDRMIAKKAGGGGRAEELAHPRPPRELA